MINTHGYVKAFGTMILNDLIKIVSPDLIINLTKVGNQLEDESDGGEAEQNQGQDFSELMCLLGSSTKLTL